MDSELLGTAAEYHGGLSWTKGFYFNFRFEAVMTELAISVVFQFDTANIRVVNDHLPPTGRVFFQVEVDIFSHWGGGCKVIVWSDG